jgi:hypothetical protein
MNVVTTPMSSPSSRLRREGGRRRRLVELVGGRRDAHELTVEGRTGRALLEGVASTWAWV